MTTTEPNASPTTSAGDVDAQPPEFEPPAEAGAATEEIADVVAPNTEPPQRSGELEKEVSADGEPMISLTAEGWVAPLLHPTDGHAVSTVGDEDLVVPAEPPTA